MATTDLESLGTQFREAKLAIGTHRARQAQAEVALHRLRRTGLPDVHADIAAATSVVDKASADVEWCRALLVAAGEAYKGQTLAQVLANQDGAPARAALIAQAVSTGVVDSEDQ